MTKPSFYLPAAGVFALLLIGMVGGCKSSASSETTKSSTKSATNPGAMRTPPPGLNISAEQAQSKAAQESAAKLAAKQNK